MASQSAQHYGVIGNTLGGALISPIGSIDWCALPFLDSPCHFGFAFDEGKGGRFQLFPQGDFRTQQRYHPKSLVLETVFETPTGRAVLSDWMPMDSPSLVRQIDTLEGRITWLLICSPRFNYGTEETEAEKHALGILFRGHQPEELCLLQADIPLELSSMGASAMGRFMTQAGQSHQFHWIWGRHGTAIEITDPSQRRRPNRDAAIEQWNPSAHRCSLSGCIFGGPWHELVSRSSQLLKLMATPYTGSVADAVAIVTEFNSSHPKRNWGHRFATLRNGSLVLQAFIHLGQLNEARAYFNWVCGILRRDGTEALQSYYTLDGGRYLPPRYEQTFQLDIYGHVILTAWTYFQNFGVLPSEVWPVLVDIADYLCQAWKRPDFGPWGTELPTKPEHHVVSKLFCWAALDKMVALSQVLNESPAARWKAEASHLHQTICDQGFDSVQNTFVKAFGSREGDSNSLWFPLLNFLPNDDPRIQGTLAYIRAQLSEGVLILRELNMNQLVPLKSTVDLFNSFLMILCLVVCDKGDEASDRLAELSTYASPLGIFESSSRPSYLPTSAWCLPSSAIQTILVNAALYVGSARLGKRKFYSSLLGMPEQISAQKIA